MPFIKMINNPYSNKTALRNVLDYIIRNAAIYGGLAIDPDCAEFQMQLVKELFYKIEGRQVRHFIVAFAEHEDVDLDNIHELAQKIALYYAHRYQIIFGIHMNTKNTHIHFALNTVSYIDGRMYREGFGDGFKLKAHISALLPGMAINITEDSVDI